MIELRASKIKCVNGGNGLTAVSTLINKHAGTKVCVYKLQTHRPTFVRASFAEKEIERLIYKDHLRAETSIHQSKWKTIMKNSRCRRRHRRHRHHFSHQIDMNEPNGVNSFELWKSVERIFFAMMYFRRCYIVFLAAAPPHNFFSPVYCIRLALHAFVSANLLSIIYLQYK